MTLKRTLTLLLIGFLIGLLFGAGAAYWRRTQRQPVGPATPTSAADAPLTLRCTGGVVPRVHVSWDPRLTSVMGGLERTSDGVNWTPLFVGGATPSPAGFDDSDVLPDTEYQYRYRVMADAPYTQSSVTTDKNTCQ